MQKSVQLLVLMLVTLQLNSSNCESAERVFHLKDLVADCKNKIEIFVKLSDEANGEVHKLIFILSTGEIVNETLSIKIEGNYNKSDADVMPCVYQGINQDNHSSVFGALSNQVFRSEFEFNNKWYEIEPFNLSKKSTAIANPILINTTELTGNNYESVVNFQQPTDHGVSMNYSVSAADPADYSRPSIRKKRSPVRVESYWGIKPAKILRLVVAADKSFVSQTGGQQIAVSRIIEIINYVSGIYHSFNMRVVMVQLILLQSGAVTPESEYSSHVTLHRFANYKAFQINVQHDAAVYLSAKHFDGKNTAGAAFMTSMCHKVFAASIAADIHKQSVKAAWIIAQNIGKNIGFNHVENLANCRCSRYYACVMNKHFDISVKPRWSKCSRETWESQKNSIHRSCLHDDSPPKSYISSSSSSGSSSCGNGIIENNEQCDCGPPELCSSNCCDAVTCKLKPGAKCASGSCCNWMNCQFKPRGHVCRPAADTECDLQETCNGSSEWCPDDDAIVDGKQCAIDYSMVIVQKPAEAYCYKGKCQTRQKQCQKLFHDSSAKVAHDYCYAQLNGRSDNKGHCSFHLTGSTAINRGSKLSYQYLYQYHSCHRANKKCGLLHCESAIKPSDSNNMVYGNTNCQSRPKLDLSSSGERSPSLVPNGAACGNGRMCVDSECRSVTDFACKNFCPNCNGNGFITRNKLCFCHKGFAPPNCVSRGCGGSVSSTLCDGSGPSSKNVGREGTTQSPKKTTSSRNSEQTNEEMTSSQTNLNPEFKAMIFSLIITVYWLNLI